MNLDYSALRQGGAIALAVGVPCAIGSSVMASGGNGDGNSPFVALLWLGAVAGFVIGAGIAAWLQRRGTPLTHGVVCAGGTYAAAQIVFSIVRLARGREVSWLGLFFTFTVVLFAGVIGGGLGGMLQRRGFRPEARSQSSRSQSSRSQSSRSRSTR
jgi:peptidoglycan/LPS O-acetylase OafA/YrhL